MANENLLLRSVKMTRFGQWPEHFPYTVPVIQNLDELTFSKPVTFLVGENGSGKSTFLEALACAVGSACFSFLFGGGLLDSAAALVSGFVLQLFLFAVEAAVRGLVFAEVGLDEAEVAPRILGQAVQFQREDDFLALDRIDVGPGHAFQALAKGFDRAAPGETVCR